MTCRRLWISLVVSDSDGVIFNKPKKEYFCSPKWTTENCLKDINP